MGASVNTLALCHVNTEMHVVSFEERETERGRLVEKWIAAASEQVALRPWLPAKLTTRF